MLRILALGQHAEVSAGWRRGTSYWKTWRVEEHNPVDTVGIKDPEGKFTQISRLCCGSLCTEAHRDLLSLSAKTRILQLQVSTNRPPI
jgi:hypothetical protein